MGLDFMPPPSPYRRILRAFARPPAIALRDPRYDRFCKRHFPASKRSQTPFVCQLTRSAPRLRSLSSSLRRPYQLQSDADSTIYALSTAPGRAAIAVIRISGPACEQIYGRLCPGKPLPRRRYATLRTLYASEVNGQPKEVLDAGALVLYFPEPKTTTGESVLELHTHGSPAIVRAVFGAISQCSTPALPIRPAEPGEFTRRAFMNDRLSLPQVEALGNALAAVTEEQRRLSVQASSGDLATRYESWRAMLLAARGELEALIDFSEDQHFDETPSVLAANVAAQVRGLIVSIEICSRNAVRGELLRSGIAISLIGAPNVGKSSILNQIVGRNAAIVSGEAGTTRDVVEVGLDLGGFFCRIGDTAGLRQALQASASVSTNAKRDMQSNSEDVGEIEAEGMRRAKAQAMHSDVVILVLSIEPDANTGQPTLLIPPTVLEAAQELLALHKKVVVAVNKFDLLRPGPSPSSGAIAEAAILDAFRNTIARALPSIAEADVHFISVREATSSSSQEKQGSNDPGNIQPFLTSLTGTFRSLTTALRPVAEPGLESGSAPSSHLPHTLSFNDNGGPDSTSMGGAGGGEGRSGPGADTMPPPRSSSDDPNEEAHRDAAPASVGNQSHTGMDLDVELDASTWESSLGATERQRVLLDTCLTSLRYFLETVQPQPTSSHPINSNDKNFEGETTREDIDIVLAAEALRSAAFALGKITGRNEAGGVGDVEEVLGVVFEKFCVGK